VEEFHPNNTRMIRTTKMTVPKAHPNDVAGGDDGGKR
jgi:hypothetical protein